MIRSKETFARPVRLGLQLGFRWDEKREAFVVPWPRRLARPLLVALAVIGIVATIACRQLRR